MLSERDFESKHGSVKVLLVMLFYLPCFIFRHLPSSHCCFKKLTATALFRKVGKGQRPRHVKQRSGCTACSTEQETLTATKQMAIPAVSLHVWRNRAEWKKCCIWLKYLELKLRSVFTLVSSSGCKKSVHLCRSAKSFYSLVDYSQLHLLKLTAVRLRAASRWHRSF